MEYENFPDIRASAFYETSNAENITQNPTELEFNQTHPIKTPKPAEMRTIFLSDVKRVKDKCLRLRSERFQFGELILGGATLFFGASLGAIAGHLPYESRFISVLFYTIFPALGVGCLIWYIRYKKREVEDAHQIGQEIEEIMDSIDEGER